ncbi:MAG: hypothetical protein LBU44_04865 [Mediterranea sp.]|jgi:hypothetical protein|nr:hypothetical protein [Mediterranea sp.]
MAKKKKTKTDTKTLQAQSRNKFIRQMKTIYDRIHPDLFLALTSMDKNVFYSMRGTLIRTKCEQSISKLFLRSCDEFIKLHMTSVPIVVIPDKLSVSLWEYTNYFIPLDVWVEENIEFFEGVEWFEEYLNGREKRSYQYELSMHTISMSLMHSISDQQEGMVHFEYKTTEKIRTNGNPFFEQTYLLTYYIPKETQVIFSDKRKKKRTAIEVVYGGHKVLEGEGYVPLAPFSMRPSQLGVKAGKDEKPLPVFILKHALERLKERLSCITVGLSEAHIVSSMLKGNICYTPEGSLLVEYYILDKKAGYFIVDVDERAILIRTFLFLTNASTPEGENLRKYIGLQKDDVKFLNIDRLAPLIESDFLKDEELCTLFMKAGCESLIELCGTLKEHEFWKQPEEKKQLGENLKKYIRLGFDDDLPVYDDLI